MNDYNQWKDKIATLSNNSFKIKRKDKNSLDNIAYNNEGKQIGEWKPNSNSGFIINK